MAACPHCGKELPDGTKFCAYCGASLQAAPPAYQSPAPYAQPGYGALAYFTPRPAPTGVSPMMIVGMILSILSIILFGIALGTRSMAPSTVLLVLGLVCAIVGVILSAKGKNRSGRARGMGIAGLVVGIIMIVVCAIFSFVFLLGSASPRALEALDDILS